VHVETSAVPLGTTRGGTVRARETSVWSGDMRVVPFMVQQEVGRSGSICFLLHPPGGPAVMPRCAEFESNRNKEAGRESVTWAGVRYLARYCSRFDTIGQARIAQYLCGFEAPTTGQFLQI
jgi:hypothetical protein